MTEITDTQPALPSTSNTSLVSNNVYDVLKSIVQLYLPASATLYFSLAAIWGFPNPEAVVSTAAAVATFGGVVLKISSKAYTNSGAAFGGAINVSTSDDGKKVFTLELNQGPEAIEQMDAINFKVNR